MSSQRTAHSFAVDPVAVFFSRPYCCTVREATEKIIGSPVESCLTPEAPLVYPHGFHSLIETVHRAYDEHRPLSLSPADISLTIIQGLGACFRAEPGHYGSYFAQPSGKPEIIVQCDNFVMGLTANDWQSVLPLFSRPVRQNIGEEMYDLLLANFTTSGAIERAACEAGLLDAAPGCLDFKFRTSCGIPAVTLTGTASDWDILVQKVRGLKQFGGLDWWLDVLIPVAEQFAAAANKKVDLRFWRNLYNGFGTTADGELLKLIPYTSDGQKNPIVTGQSRSGLSARDLPRSYACVPFTWDYRGVAHPYQLVVGHLGSQFYLADAALNPFIGWAVRRKL